MKAIRFTILLMFVSFFAFGQSNDNEQKVFDGIAQAVKNGQSAELSAYFASSLECDILGKDNVFSKPQATQVMKDFFAKNKPKTFSTLHKSGKGQAKFIIGSYTTTNGDVYRMTFFVKQESGNYLVQQIRIENGNSE